MRLTQLPSGRNETTESDSSSPSATLARHGESTGRAEQDDDREASTEQREAVVAVGRPTVSVDDVGTLGVGHRLDRRRHHRGVPRRRRDHRRLGRGADLGTLSGEVDGLHAVVLVADGDPGSLEVDRLAESQWLRREGHRTARLELTLVVVLEVRVTVTQERRVDREISGVGERDADDRGLAVHLGVGDLDLGRTDWWLWSAARAVVRVDLHRVRRELGRVALVRRCGVGQDVAVDARCHRGSTGRRDDRLTDDVVVEGAVVESGDALRGGPGSGVLLDRRRSDLVLDLEVVGLGAPALEVEARAHLHLVLATLVGRVGELGQLHRAEGAVGDGDLLDLGQRGVAGRVRDADEDLGQVVGELAPVDVDVGLGLVLGVAVDDVAVLVSRLDRSGEVRAGFSGRRDAERLVTGDGDDALLDDTGGVSGDARRRLHGDEVPPVGDSLALRRGHRCHGLAVLTDLGVLDEIAVLVVERQPETRLGTRDGHEGAVVDHGRVVRVAHRWERVVAGLDLVGRHVTGLGLGLDDRGAQDIRPRGRVVDVGRRGDRAALGDSLALAGLVAVDPLGCDDLVIRLVAGAHLDLIGGHGSGLRLGRDDRVACHPLPLGRVPRVRGHRLGAGLRDLAGLTVLVPIGPVAIDDLVGRLVGLDTIGVADRVVADVLPRGVGDHHRLLGRVDVDGDGTTGATIGGAGLDAVAVDQLALGRGDGDGLSAIIDVNLARVELGTDLLGGGGGGGDRGHGWSGHEAHEKRCEHCDDRRRARKRNPERPLVSRH